MHCQRNNSTRMAHEAGRLWLCGRFTSSGCAELVAEKDSSCTHASPFFWPHHQNQWLPLSHLWPCWQLQIKELTEQAHTKGSSGFSKEESPCSCSWGAGFRLFSQKSEFFSSLSALLGTFTVTFSDVCLPTVLWPKQELYWRKLNWVLYVICLSLLGWTVTNRRNTRKLQCLGH